MALTVISDFGRSDRTHWVDWSDGCKRNDGQNWSDRFEWIHGRTGLHRGDWTHGGNGAYGNDRLRRTHWRNRSDGLYRIWEDRLVRQYYGHPSCVHLHVQAFTRACPHARQGCLQPVGSLSSVIRLRRLLNDVDTIRHCSLSEYHFR